MKKYGFGNNYLSKNNEFYREDYYKYKKKWEEFESKQKDYEERIKKLNDDLKQKEDLIENYEKVKNENELLKEKINELNAKNDEIESIKKNKEYEITRLNRQLIREKENSKYYENKYKEMMKDFRSMKDNINTLKTEKYNLEKENRSNQSEISRLEKTTIKLDKELKGKEETINEINEEKNKITKDLNEKIKEIKKIEGVFNQFNRVNDDKDLEQIKKEKKELETKNKELKNLVNKGETKIEYIKNEAEKYYDVVIDIDSIYSLRNRGWEIKYNKERKEIYEKIINEETMKIGVLGLNNVGKSYLLSKIVNADIPTGHSIETKGISIKYSEGNKEEEVGICILDSAGFETPLLENGNSNQEENSENKNKEEIEKNDFDKMIKYDQKEDILSKDKTQTERFIENLIISLSDMLILVIGKLTRTEQRLITRIKNMANDNENKIKAIIIVHNLAQYNKIIEVERHINDFLLKSATFKIIKKQVLGLNDYTGRYYFVEKPDKNNNHNNIEVFHYLMAKEGTEAGDYYNELTMQLIKQQYNNSNQRKAIDIPKQIKKLFCDLSDDIIGEKIKEDQIETIDEKTIKFKDNKDNNKRNENSDFQIQNAYIDQDGNYLRNKGKYEPKYSLYVYREGDDEDEYENYLLLRIEIPGNITRLTARSTDPKEERYTGIIIKGIKEKDEIPEKNKRDYKNIRDTRTYDEINFFIELKGKLALHKKLPICDTEIYEIQFDKRNKEKYFKDKDNNKTTIKEKANCNNMVEGVKIACGVYIFKFSLTQNSF